MRRTRRYRLSFAVLLLAACTSAAPSGTPAPRGDIVAEARAFMDGYAVDLRTGDRAAIAARYDRRGAYFAGHGRSELETWAQIEARYRDDWRPPAAFEWRDLAYEPAGPDAVVVTGLFTWTRAADVEPLLLSYTGLLLRQDGELRIRLEDESMSPQSLRQLMPRDTTGG
jgi:hypothetical protein